MSLLRIGVLAGALLPVLASSSIRAQSSATRPTGTLPKDAQGRSLNLDFETGTLADWHATGGAFDGQPIQGDTVRQRRADMQSRHQGKFWIGGYELHRDQPQGTLTSIPFTVSEPFASFLVGGGHHESTRVELVRNDTGQAFFKASGHDAEELAPVVVDLRTQLGKPIFIRLVDEHSGGWGHVNFDDFRFHATRPEVPNAPAGADQYRFAGLLPVEAAAAMTVPEGFSVSLFAGEPDVLQPIAQAIDDRGRLWVAEAYSYPARLPEAEAHDRILIFEDTDGDGHFDTRKVFYDKLNLVSGMELGFGGVWVGAAPQLLFLPDADGDDRPDGPPQVLLDGWGSQDTHETLNSFTWGPDGWLYGCHGVFTHSRVGRPGTPDDQREPLNAGIWRYHPQQRRFEVFAQGTSNPWGIDFNDRGQAFLTACVIPHLFHIIQGGRYQRQAGQHFNPYTYDDIKTIALHRHWLGGSPHSGNNRSDSAGGGHAHAGAMIYLGGAWPAKYRDQIFMNNIHGARLNQDQLSQQGSGYVGDRAPDFLLANDSWSQILNLQYGPDGQMYMIDWYDRNQCHHGRSEGHDRGNGRIFKVSYGQPKPVHVDLKKLTDSELVQLQLDSNDWYVRHARRILQERKPNPQALDALREMLARNADETRRLRALWALHVCGATDEALLLGTLADASPWVRAWSIQLLAEVPTRSLSPKAKTRFAELAQSDNSPVVRLYLASALGRLPPEDRWSILAPLVRHAEDAGDHNLPLMVWYAAEPLAAADPARLLSLAEQTAVPLLLKYTVQRIGAIGTPEAIALLVEGLSRAPDDSRRLLLLTGLNEALKGRRQVEMPPGWPKVAAALAAAKDARLRGPALALAVTFGDPAAVAQLRAILVNVRAPLNERLEALAGLLKVRPAGLAAVLQPLVAEPAMRPAVLRGLAAYDDPHTPEVVLARYSEYNLGEKQDALNTLAARPASARALLAAVAGERLPAADLSADLVRQLHNLKDSQIDQQLEKLWGTVRETPQDKQKLIADYKTLLARKPQQPPDLSLGRAIFAKTCQQCHTLFGAGGKVGPELTGSNRANLDYLLSNILDPSALIGKGYQAQIIATDDGRVFTGIIRADDRDSLTLATANDTVVIPKNEIAEQQLSTKSMMPEDILKPLNESEMRSLVAYLASPVQVPLLVVPGVPVTLFNGRDLSGWSGNVELWSVEEGELVGRTTGLKRNEFLASELLLDDFRLSCEVKLVRNQGNSGIQFRSELRPGGEVRGYQADIGAGWWGKLYEELGRGLLWKQSGEAHVKLGQWNRYEIVAIGPRVRTWINGQPCVELDDPAGSLRGIVALQLHSGGPTEVRYRNFQLDLQPRVLEPTTAVAPAPLAAPRAK